MSASSAAFVLAALLQAEARTDAPLTGETTRPRLIVLVSVDQMLPSHLDRLAPWLSGGLAEFVRKGRVFPNAALNYGDTETGPGHATFGTGMFPRHHGIISNNWFETQSSGSMYCFGDADSRLVTSRGVEESRASSPRNFRVDGIADVLESLDPNAQTIGISAKDRSAIGLTGRHADFALWWDKKRGGFATSTWYGRSLPAWVVAANANWIERTPFAVAWNHELPADLSGSGTSPDECDGEWGKPGERSFPHPSPKRGAELSEKELATLASWVYDRAAGDVLVLDMAKRAVVEMGLGRDDVIDLLSISLSSCDTVGHAYGPYSMEVTDVLLRADRELGVLFRLLDEQVGAGRWIAALSADHGVLDLPETLAARGYPSRRISGRIIGDSIKAARNAAAAKFGADFHLSSDARGVRLSVPAMRAAGHEPALVRRFYAESLLASGREWLQHVVTFDELEAIARNGRAANGLIAMEANSFDAERSADLVLLVQPWCLAGVMVGTTHGTPYDYDRAVPLAFIGPGVVPGRDHSPASSCDAVPTVLGLAGIRVERAFDGRAHFGTK